jgi:hypothetical protein
VSLSKYIWGVAFHLLIIHLYSDEQCLNINNLCFPLIDTLSPYLDHLLFLYLRLALSVLGYLTIMYPLSTRLISISLLTAVIFSISVNKLASWNGIALAPTSNLDLSSIAFTVWRSTIVSIDRNIIETRNKMLPSEGMLLEFYVSMRYG